MKCSWTELLNVLPIWLRPEVDKLGRDCSEELRLRLNSPPELRRKGTSHWLKGCISQEDLNYCVNAASRFSPWSAVGIGKGYLTAQGGHRIGLCGEAVVKDGMVTGIRNVSSLCIRIARDFPGIAAKLGSLSGSVLILGAPGWGKTTLLRDLIRQRSEQGCAVSVVDERGEIFPAGFDTGKCTEVLTGCPKSQGVEMVLRTMGPRVIAVDEITAKEDCETLVQAAWCGVDLIATVHASSHDDLHRRSIYAPLVSQQIFQNIVILHPDKTWHVERSRV